MSLRTPLLLAVGLLLAACGEMAAFEYRVASKDPKVSSAQLLTVVNRALDRPEDSMSAPLSAWAKVDDKTGEVTFGLVSSGSGKTPSVRNTEARLLRDLRSEFGDRVEVYCNGERIR